MKEIEAEARERKRGSGGDRGNPVSWRILEPTSADIRTSERILRAEAVGQKVNA